MARIGGLGEALLLRRSGPAPRSQPGPALDHLSLARWQGLVPLGSSGSRNPVGPMKHTPLKRKTGLKRKAPLSQGSSSTLTKGGSNSTLRRDRSISPASPAQRRKARDEPCVVTGTTREFNVVDPAHLWAAGRGGCKDPLCVVPLVREVHHRFDNGDFDLLPYLVRRRVPELQHALEHAEGDLLGLLHRLTGERFAPVRIVHGDDGD